jgi:hypothetical protein
MTDRTWTEAVSNDAGDPLNWSPSDSAPQSGDTLIMPNRIVVNGVLINSTMNITDDVLQGDTLTVTLAVPFGTPTLNLSDNANLSLSASSTLTNSLAVRVNVDGNATVNGRLGSDGPVAHPQGASATVNVTHGNLFGTWDEAQASSVTINGNDRSRYHNDGTDTLGGSMRLNIDVVGSGAFIAQGSIFNRGSFLEFGGSVSGGQTVDLTGGVGDFSTSPLLLTRLQVDHPDEFHGTVDLHDRSLADLVGLAQADSWSYKNDLLTLRNVFGQVVDKVHIVSDALSTGDVHGLSVSKSSAGDVLVSPGTDFKGSLALPTS